MISGSLHFQMDPSPYPVQARRLIEYICNVASLGLCGRLKGDSLVCHLQYLGNEAGASMYPP